jgi:hypothetical protein
VFMSVFKDESILPIIIGFLRMVLVVYYSNNYGEPPPAFFWMYCTGGLTPTQPPSQRTTSSTSWRTSRWCSSSPSSTKNSARR